MDQNGTLSSTDLAERLGVGGVFLGEADFEDIVKSGIPERRRNRNLAGKDYPEKLPAKMDREVFRQVIDWRRLGSALCYSSSCNVPAFARHTDLCSIPCLSDHVRMVM